ncbi:hypothetical protein [Streptacidiphilus sp. EB103A]|uniref:hypothetical protein n=1 Tax=Streptacidiphilus sp. EB103A TaxID=3156275 RepID=UPI003515D73D
MIDIEAHLPAAEQQTADTARLLALAELLGVDPTDLDEAVHDAAARYASERCNNPGTADEDQGDSEGEEAEAEEEDQGDDGEGEEELYEGLYGEAGRQAAAVNNGGLDAQIPYILAQYGAESAERLIREAA